MPNLNSATIVILARNYNPSIVSKDWLQDKGLLRGAVSNFVHTPAFSLVQTDQLALVVDENRLQLSLQRPSEWTLRILRDTADDFVQALPETPYTGVGFNLHYQVPKEEFVLESLLSVNRERLAGLVGERNEMGGKIVFEYNGFVAKMDISPSLGEDEAVRVDFNFHADIRGSSEVREQLSLYENVVAKAEAIVRGLGGND